MATTGEDFVHRRLGPGLDLHLHHTDRFKSTRVDILIPALLRRPDHTRLALIGRLLERGTRQLPDLRRLNRFLDRMYGAAFAADVEQVGDRQVIHLSLEVVDNRYLLEREDLLAQGLRFLVQVLRQPVQEGEGFARAYLQQEKKALRFFVANLANDKSAYAQRRCIEEMCPDEPYGLPAYGDPADLRGIDAVRLLRFHRRVLATHPIDVFISGRPDPEYLARLAAELFAWPRQPLERAWGLHRGSAPSAPRQVFEAHAVNQGRLVLGYRTGASVLEDYPALLLFNAVWGGDTHSRLFRHVREASGLCYHVASQIEPMCGLLFVEAGVEHPDYQRVRREVHRQLDVVRRGRLAEAEVEAARRVMVQRLQALDDNRDGLLRFHYHHHLAGLRWSRHDLQARLEAVTRRDLRRVSEGVALDTVYFLHGGPPPAAQACAG
jgi:predicted Zn-dependent peptidase